MGEKLQVLKAHTQIIVVVWNGRETELAGDVNPN
jgi:hypothetical protein